MRQLPALLGIRERRVLDRTSDNTPLIAKRSFRLVFGTGCLMLSGSLPAVLKKRLNQLRQLRLHWEAGIHGSSRKVPGTSPAAF